MLCSWRTKCRKKRICTFKWHRPKFCINGNRNPVWLYAAGAALCEPGWVVICYKPKSVIRPLNGSFFLKESSSGILPLLLASCFPTCLDVARYAFCKPKSNPQDIRGQSTQSLPIWDKSFSEDSWSLFWGWTFHCIRREVWTFVGCGKWIFAAYYPHETVKSVLLMKSASL